MADLAVVILTLNEEIHIARAIKSVQSVAREIFVIDSYSTDRTVDIARQLGAMVLQNKFLSHSKQFNWALETAPITSAWVMRLDADEYIEPDLVRTIQERLPLLPDEVTGINLKRRHIFMNRWIRHGGRYPLVLLRLWRRGIARIEDRWMDEHVVLSRGRSVTFDGGFSDHNLNDITFFIAKHNRYATLEAIEILDQRHNLFPVRPTLSAASSSMQAAGKRMFKEKLFNRIPYPASVFVYFTYRYVVRLGFLDGIEGLIYHFLQGFWYRFLVGAKVVEYERAIKDISSTAGMRSELARLTNIGLTD
jgi:glycosyltransferase involved in cell wall biosynthesis